MKKFLVGITGLLVFAGIASAEVDARAMSAITRILNGEKPFTVMNTADANVSDDLAVTSDASVGGSLTVTGSASVGSLLALTPGTAIAVTNAQVLSPISTVVTLNPPEAGTTNTIATPYSTGDFVVFTVAATNGGTVTFADATTELALGSDVTLGATDTLMVLFTGTNTAVSLGTQDN